jgi:hypothetical protein
MVALVNKGRVVAPKDLAKQALTLPELNASTVHKLHASDECGVSFGEFLLDHWCVCRAARDIIVLIIGVKNSPLVQSVLVLFGGYLVNMSASQTTYGRAN